MSVNKVNKTTGDLSLLAGGTLYADSPIGSIIPYGGATAPAGWFICDGTELVRATYPELFAVIGTSFGTPSDNTKFKLPDLREATTKGVGLTGKSNNHYDADGLALGEFIDDRMQDWRGVGKWRSFTPVDEDGWAFITQSASGYEILGRYGDTTEVKAVGVNYIIKAVSVGVPTDFMSAVDEAISNIDTADITEFSALANIGTSANATQHDVNVAINDNALLSKADPVGGGQTFNGDLNDLTTPGVYSIVTTSQTLKPGTFYGTALVYKGKFGYLNQEVMDVLSARKWVRARTESGNWSNWVELTEPKTVSLYLTTPQLGITVDSTVSVERFISSLWNYLTTIYPQADYFNVSGQMEWDDSQSFNITDGNRVITSSGAKFDFFIRNTPWSCNGGILLTPSSGAYRVRCKYLDSTSNIQEDIFQITLV